MQTNQISLETEIALIAIAKEHYPYAHFKLNSNVEENWANIDFVAYLTESALCERPYTDPCHTRYQIDSSSFGISFNPQSTFLFVFGDWRGASLTLHYDGHEYLWSDEGKDIPRPYPDGDKFEAIAKQIYPILIKE